MHITSEACRWPQVQRFNQIEPRNNASNRHPNTLIGLTSLQYLVLINLYIAINFFDLLKCFLPAQPGSSRSTNIKTGV
jgi:hypothetical protein